ncbi:MAG: TetR/AcrR family transcriptional regulator [Alphaproteobacteria bacterium]|nr:TetR/AcrR family transcriptional regulator [Alphaproteobacteria bacterium]
MEKENIQQLLLQVGKKLVCERGVEALTARKLSEASGCSVGAIYNQFSNMDNFVVVLNYMTLDELLHQIQQIEMTDDAHADMNNIVRCFTRFVGENQNMWFMLYNFYLRAEKQEYSFLYLRNVAKIVNIVSDILQRILPDMERPERILSSQILWLTMFALSPFLTRENFQAASKINSTSVCQIVLNTFVAGLTILEKKN